MSDTQMNETQPVTPAPAAPVDETQQKPSKPKRKFNWWIVGGIFAVLIIGAVGATAGYYSGIENRKAVENNNRALAASMQYQLGVTDLQAGRYEFAKQRFEYVIQIDPGFPGVLEKMAELAIIVNATATPTPAPVLTPVPTLDLSGVESLLSQAKQFLVAKDWNSAISALDAIRKQNSSFKTLEVDGLYYLALRYRGIEKINQLGELESGIYDIVLMSRFGPVDKESRDADEWAKYYIYGASSWGIDWLKVVKDIQVVYANFPYMQDQAHMTAMERYRIALSKVGDTLSLKGKWCEAVPYYQQSLQVGSNEQVIVALTKANNKCAALTPSETPTGPVVPVETPIVEPTSADTTTPPTDIPPTAVPPTEVPTVETTPPGG